MGDCRRLLDPICKKKRMPLAEAAHNNRGGILQEPLLLRSFLDTFAEGVCLLGETGDVRGMNAAAERLLGYKADELLGGPFHPNREIFRDGDASGDGVATAVDWRSMHPMNSEFRRKNGSLIDVVCTLHPLERDDVGSILLTFREREREPVEAIALKDIEAKFGAVFDTMPDGLIVIDENGLIGFFSSGAERLFDYRRSEALGKNVAMLMPSPYREAHDGYLAAYRDDRRQEDHRHWTGSGRTAQGWRNFPDVFVHWRNMAGGTTIFCRNHP